MANVTIPLIIRRSQLKAIVGVSPSQIDIWEAKNEWPKRIRYSPGVVGWDRDQVLACIASKVNNAQENSDAD